MKWIDPIINMQCDLPIIVFVASYESRHDNHEWGHKNCRVIAGD